MLKGVRRYSSHTMSALFAADKIKGDRYNGVTVALEEKDCRAVDTADFSVALETALEGWKGAGKKGVWLRVPAGLHRFVSPALELGMQYHHARPEYIMLNAWLVEGTSRLPNASHHQAGVGGLVICPNGTHVLVIREKSGITANMANFWKLPGGLVDQKEDLWAATEREVWEETGIKTVYRRLAGFREHHGALFGNSDFYFVGILQLDPDEYPDAIAGGPLPKPVPCELEIADAKWMPLDDWTKLPFMARPGLYRDLMLTSVDIAYHVHNEKEISGMHFASVKGQTQYHPKL